MNFEAEYTPEQEAFRKEVSTWLDKNVPPGLITDSVRPEGNNYEQYLRLRELGRRLGAKGWLYPTYPREYGGGGLGLDHAVILHEEMDKRNSSLPPYYDSGGRLGGPSILVWGTEEQKRHFLPPMFRGEKRSFQALTEPEAGSDLAGVRTTAVRDGDDYVINGTKIFIGSSHPVEQIWTLTVTNPKGPRHQNLSWFVIPADTPGITITPMELLGAGGESTGDKNTIYFDNVRVPAFNLIGGENNGWKVAQTHLELEHGGGGAVGRDRIWEKLLAYCQKTHRNGRPLSQDPDVRDMLVDIFIDSEVVRLFGLRNFYLAHAHKPRSYEGPQLSYVRKGFGLKRVKLIQDILGPYTLTDDPVVGACDGHMESHQRNGIVAVHPGGTMDVQRVVMARRLALGRAVREEAGALA